MAKGSCVVRRLITGNAEDSESVWIYRIIFPSPCVFRYQNEIFMVPECARSGKITVYKSVKFPCQWQEAYVLYEGEGVDTTPVLQDDKEDELLFFTTLKTKENRENNCLYAVSRNRKEKLLIENDDTVRSAGHLIWNKNELLRPAQDCTRSYGGALIFKRISTCSLEFFGEEDFAKIEADDVKVDCSQYMFNGVLTYNQSEQYEMIDLSYDVGKEPSVYDKKLKKHFTQRKIEIRRENELKFSVLIPVYNTEEYLEECLRSILNQTYQDFEIILVDDGSTDNSVAICDCYAAKYSDKVTVIHKQNQGLISARRVGVSYASGEYSVFVDSDDFVKKQFLECICQILDNDEAIDLLIYSFSYVKNGQIVKDFPRISSDGYVWDSKNREEIITKLLFSHDVTPIWIKAVRTSLLQADPTDYTQYYGKNMAEDTFQSLYLVTYAKKIVYYCLPLYCYNYNDDSISRSYTHATLDKKNTLHVYNKILEYLPCWSMENETTIKRLQAVWFNDMMDLFCKCYGNAKNKKEKMMLLNYHWDRLVPNDSVQIFSEYTGPDFIQLYAYIKEKSYYKLSGYFRRKKMYTFYKKVMRKVLNE